MSTVTGHWEVHYEPCLYWAQCGGVFVYADTIEGLFAEMVATTAVLKGWDESDRRETVQDAWRQR